MAGGDSETLRDLLHPLVDALTGALVSLGVLAYESDDRALAVEYFDRALELDDGPVVRANRELALTPASS